MKKQILILFVLLSAIGYTQNGINYKALIKDDSGNVIANTTVQIQFTIVEDVTNVYTETHSPTTDANGIIIVNIGEGTATSGNFNTINWAEENHSVNVQIDTGSGLVDLGTTQFMSVPYAKHANTATTAANATGIETIDEGNGFGWRLTGRDPNNYGNIGFNATDLSINFSPSTTRGATGDRSTAMGSGTTASEFASTAMGFNTNASGAISTAMGGSTTASGDGSTAMGSGTIASGDRSTAMGNFTTASALASTTMGSGTTASGDNSTAMGGVTEASGDNSTTMGFDTEASGDNSTAMGSVTTASGASSIAMGNSTIASEFASTAMGSITTASGSRSTAMGSGTNASGVVSTAIGSGTTASGSSSTAMGSGTAASGSSSTAMGSGTTASGVVSTAIGSGTTASGSNSTAMGQSTDASGNSSTAMGFATTALGENSTAMGRGTIASSYNSTAMGRFNIGGGFSNSWISFDPLFEIGNGTSNSNRSNAVTVLKNGNVGIGTNTPQERLHISGGRLGIGDETIEDTGSNQLSVDASLIPTTNNAFRLGNASNRWIGVWATDGTINTSDRREKKNIKNLNYGLKEVLQMNPVSFNWKNKNNPDTKLGLIAQDVLKIVPEVVKTHIWEKDEVSGLLTKKELDRLGVYYSDLIPVLIKAIQEQQDIIGNQNTKIEGLTAEVTALKSMNTRIKALEALLVTKSEDVKVVSSRQ